MQRVEETAFAKINLDLRVCGRRADGYHDLDSLVAFASLGDGLTIEPARGFTLVVEGPFGGVLPRGQDNLVTRAALGLARTVDHSPDLRITLEKRLPIASGLGGGSADAAATLRGLVRFWNLALSPADLLPLARTLGADVPVCLGSRPVRMQGTGDRLTPLAMPDPCRLILVNPGAEVSTPEVFRALEAMSGERQAAPGSAADGSFWNALADSVNDLEAPAMRLEPAIAGVLRAIRGQPGCGLARMSGSGATCFGLFRDVAERDRAVTALGAAHPGWWIVGADGR